MRQKELLKVSRIHKNPWLYFINNDMTYEQLKVKHPDLNWDEAEEISEDDLQAASNKLDEIMKEDN